ncbi:MAG TPA: hypothetical protein VM260_20225, partial [Pirellula sp.]|nr:hypothetical protein [Pirellula sp.]
FESHQPSISEDGRYVAFSSVANNLAGGDSNNNFDVFIKDTSSGTTTIVSSDSSFIAGNNLSLEPSISANGKLVAFRSASSDLVAGDSNGRDDIFIKDMSTGSITRVSTDSLSAQANNHSYQPSINADGKFLAFRSSASNLVAGDTNGVDDIFVKNLSTGTLIRVSPNSLSVQGNGNSLDPSISGNGAFVAFNSLANNLHPNDLNTGADVFRVSTIDNGEFAISITATDGAIAPENSIDTGTIRFAVSKASATPTYVWLDIPQNTPTNALFSDWTASLSNGASLTIGTESRSVTNRSLLSDIVTLTTTTDHNYVVGQSIVVSGIGSAFDGNYTIASVPTSTTFTYARPGLVDQVSAGLLGTVTTSSNALLLLPAGVTEVLMTLAAIGDTTVELDEAIDFKLATIKGPGGVVPPSLHTVGVPNAATVTIVNDDVSVITLAPNPVSDLQGNDPDSVPSTSFPSSGGDAQCVVQLSSPSSQDTVLTYSVAAPPAHGVQDFWTDFALGVPGAISTLNGGNGIVSVVNAGGANGNALEVRRATGAIAMTSANSATLTVNLEAFKTTGGAVLTLDHVKLGNELVDNSFAGLGTADAFVSNPDVDGIAISTDGITYYPLLNLTSTANGIAINLERALYDRGLLPSSAVRIRFLQFDAGVANNLTDTGRRFDNIRVVSGDYAALSGTVTVPAGNVTAAINISVLNDLLVEGTENVSVTLISLSSAIPNVSLDPTSVNLTQVASITDSDSAVAVIEAAAYGSEQLPA